MVDEQEEIRSALAKAGRITLHYFGNVKSRQKTSQDLVTEADLSVQKYLVSWLQRRYPRHGIIAEEDECHVAPDVSGRFWTVDPVDGTSSFVAGLPVWGIGLGEADPSGPSRGYFYLPVTRDYFCLTDGGRMLMNGRHVSLKPPGRLHSESVLLSISRLHQHLTLNRDYPGKVRNLGSTIGHMCYVAAGIADVALLGRVWIWDLIPGWAMVRASGGILKYLHGRIVRMTDLIDGDRAQGLMLCGHPEAVQRYENVLSRRALLPR